MQGMLMAELDLQEHWKPDGVAESQARLLLEATPGAEMAVLALVQPGKDQGIWTFGQKVETVAGLILLACSRKEPVPGTMRYSDARNIATEVAEQALKTQFDDKGTTAYVLVYPGQAHMPVFES